MEFDLDDLKEAKTRRERGISFVDAALIFDGHVVEWEDQRRDYGEKRMVAVGRVGTRFLTVVYVDRGDLRRIISAWPSNRKEREQWLG